MGSTCSWDGEGKKSVWNFRWGNLVESDTLENRSEGGVARDRSQLLALVMATFMFLVLLTES